MSVIVNGISYPLFFVRVYGNMLCGIGKELFFADDVGGDFCLLEAAA
jgi:hypothetical protein